MARDKTAIDFVASMDVVEANLGLFHQGRRQVYRPIATELRKLVPDGASSLLPRVFEEVRLHKLASTERFEKGPPCLRELTLFSSSILLVTSTVTRCTLELAESGAWMALDDRLQQCFLSPQISVKDFIRSVADKEGAHADPAPNATLAFNASISYGGEVSHAHEIAVIGKYIADFVRNQDLRVRAGVPLRRVCVGEAWQLGIE